MAARSWTWTGAALVVVVAVAVYANSFDGALMYDDTNAIIRNRVVIDEEFTQIFTTPSWWRAGHGRGWRPITTASFALNHALHGLEPWGYHAANVALHAGVSVLVVAVFASVTGGALAALGAGLLFAAHPVHTEAVASVVGRSELLAAAAFFLAWVCFLRADRYRRALWDAGGVLVFFAGLLAKENTITLLPVLVLVDLLYPKDAQGPRAVLWRHAGRYGALLLAVVVYIAFRQLIIGSGAPGPLPLDNPLITLPFGARALTTIEIVGRYAWRLAVPLQLAADYSYDQIGAVTSPLDGGFLAGLAVLIAVPVVGWWSWTRMPALAFGIGFLTATFALVANIAFPIGTIMAERLVYLPSAGACLIVAVLLVHLTGGDAREGDPRKLRQWLAVALLVMVGLYGARTVTRNRVWHDPETFFVTMVREAPRSARSHRELGGVLADLGRHAEAGRAFERSLAILPDDVATLHNYGNALVAAGDLDAAAVAYERAIAAKPDFVDAIMNLATVESRRGNLTVAIARTREALAYQPGRAGLHMNLANTYFRAGQVDDARASYEAALAAEPRSLEIRLNYGMFLHAQQDYARAVSVYEPIGTVHVRAAAGLIISYAAVGDVGAARAALARADARFPGDVSLARIRQSLGSTP